MTFTAILPGINSVVEESTKQLEELEEYLRGGVLGAASGETGPSDAIAYLESKCSEAVLRDERLARVVMRSVLETSTAADEAPTDAMEDRLNARAEAIDDTGDEAADRINEVADEME